MAVGSTQPLKGMSIRVLVVKAAGVCGDVSLAHVSTQYALQAH